MPIYAHRNTSGVFGFTYMPNYNELQDAARVQFSPINMLQFSFEVPTETREKFDVKKKLYVSEYFSRSHKTNFVNLSSCVLPLS